jgi:hypothetical protein
MSRNRSEGRYGYVRSLWWLDSGVKTLEPEESRLLLCLSTGRLSNQAGIFLRSIDCILQDFQTGRQPITREDVLGHLEALSRKPKAADAFIDFDENVIWIRHRLRDDPAKLSGDSLKGIKYELSKLPKSSRVVRRFRRHYADLLAEAPIEAPTPGPQVGLRGPTGERRSETETGERRSEIGEREKSGDRRRTVAENRSAGASQVDHKTFSLSLDSDGPPGRTPGHLSLEGRRLPPHVLAETLKALSRIASALAVRAGNGAPAEHFDAEALFLFDQASFRVRGKSPSYYATMVLEQLANGGQP